jgi:hypothetical protein
MRRADTNEVSALVAAGYDGESAAR